MKKIAFYTLGCKSNQYVTSQIMSNVQSPTSEVVDFRDFADTYIINTCTVTQSADKKSRNAISRALKKNPKAKIIVTGCYARLEGEKLKERFPGITLTPGPSPRGRGVFELAEGAVRIRSFLKIQDGCEHFCSYCVVPYARGKVRSRAAEGVLGEAIQLVEAGAREIILTGINLGCYDNLPELIKQLSKINNLYRIRLSSLEPMYITDELIETIAKTPKVCPHLHIPLQSGDDTILKAMNRGYAAKDYLGLIAKIRSKMLDEKILDLGINTDIIVGFPGEGEKEFQNTIKLIEKIKFSRIHVFSFSKRKGTPAVKFPNQINPKIINARSKELRKLGEKLVEQFAEKYKRERAEILVEGRDKKTGLLEGLTPNYVRFLFEGPDELIGKLVSSADYNFRNSNSGLAI